jgi:hypothetical protein
MGQAERPTCPDCGAPLVLALPPDGKGKRTFQCFDCDGPDPLKAGLIASCSHRSEAAEWSPFDFASGPFWPVFKPAAIYQLPAGRNHPESAR